MMLKILLFLEQDFRFYTAANFGILNKKKPGFNRLIKITQRFNLYLQLT